MRHGRGLIRALVGVGLAAALALRADAQSILGESAGAAAIDSALVRPSIILPRVGGEILPGPVDPERYRLGPGDVLSLEFSGRVNRRVPIVVDAEGRASFPELGVRAVAGRTLVDVRGEVLQRLRPLYSGARVDLRLTDLRRFKVYLAGSVNHPGAVEATAAQRASELFASAASLPPGASRRNILLKHRDGRVERVDLESFALLGREDANPFLEDGDVVLVPPRKESVFAYGAFGRPGEYELAPGDSVSRLVELAGGVLAGTDPSSGRLERFLDGNRLDSVRVSLAPIPGGADDVALRDKDRVYSREYAEYKRSRNVTLAGEFRQPGTYALHEGVDRISTLVERAGGLTTSAARGRIQIFRSPSTSGQRDLELDRLSRLSRGEMTDAEYQTFRAKLASQQAAFVVSMDQLRDESNEYDILLRDGDVLVVDRETMAVRIAGQVQRPSLIEYVPGRKGQEYIDLAGGVTERAEGGKVRVSRAGSDQTVFLDEAEPLQPGDFIWVPEKKDFSFWATMKDVILVAGSVATVIILLRDH